MVICLDENGIGMNWRAFVAIANTHTRMIKKTKHFRRRDLSLNCDEINSKTTADNCYGIIIAYEHKWYDDERIFVFCQNEKSKSVNNEIWAIWYYMLFGYLFILWSTSQGRRFLRDKSVLHVSSVHIMFTCSYCEWPGLCEGWRAWMPLGSFAA